MKDNKQTKIVFNFSNEGLGHALLISKKIVSAQGFDDRYVVWGYPRDYPKKAKDYKEKVKTQIPMAIAKNHILENSSLGDFIPTIIILPNDPNDLPRGLHPIAKFGFECMIKKIQDENFKKEMYWDALKGKDDDLKKILTSEFTSIMNEYANTMKDEAQTKPTHTPTPSTNPNEKKE